MRRSLLLLTKIPALLLGLTTAVFAGPPANFSESLVAEGIFTPTAMEFAPAPDGRLFVTQQNGLVRVIKNGSLLPAPFATFSVDNCDERGLGGITFHPNFATNPYVYVYYTVPYKAATPTTPAVPIHNRLSRLTANGDVAVAGSETILLELNSLNACNHNGGAIHFGSDGKLYVAVGENGNSDNAKTTSNLLGKILRLNADGTIPTDNPFYTSATGSNRAIWALGLRNPFTFAVQPVTGKIYINDVGNASWEEINEGVAGANYGWPTTEGATTNQTFRTPVFAYAHGTDSTTGCAITGGAFYNPPTMQFPKETYEGKYFFADYCNGWIRVLNPATGAVSDFQTGIANPVDIKIGPDGSLYYLARLKKEPELSNGSVFRVQYTGSTAPSISVQPADKRVPQGLTATFTVTASGSTPLSYKWYRNSTEITGATNASYTTPPTTTADNGALFNVKVSNSAGDVTSRSALLTVIQDHLPVPMITAPLSSYTYTAGTNLDFAGTATDQEDGTLAPSAFSWTIDFHHDTHTHPALSLLTGVRSGSYPIPSVGETSANVWYRINLTVTDSAGLIGSTFLDVRPRIATISIAALPSGLKFNLDGQPQLTPYTFDSVVGLIRNLEAPAAQTLNSRVYEFESWSDSQPAKHDLITPATNSTFTMNYRLTTQILLPVTAPGVFSFNVDFSGKYKLVGSVNNGGLGSANSFFIDIDADPATDLKRVWDLGLTSVFEEQDVSWRGINTTTCPDPTKDVENCAEFDPKIFDLAHLTTGSHTLYLRQREAGARIEYMRLIKIPGPALSAPKNLRLLPQ